MKGKKIFNFLFIHDIFLSYSKGFIHKLTNGKRHAVRYRVMDARGRLLSTKVAYETPKVIAEGDASFLSAKQTPKCIHNSIVYGMASTICFI